MKMFPPQSQDRSPRAEKAEKPAKIGVSRKKVAPPEKKQISASSIKEKLAAHSEANAVEKPKAPIETSKKLGEGFMNETIVRPPIVAPKPEEITPEAEEVKKDIILKSDIAKNNPTDTNTQEKLKAVLSRGAFNFSSKEKEALERILA
jgi:hypothetical protein